MDTFITALTSAITPTVLWGMLGDAVPFILVMVLFSLGYYIVRKLVKGASKAKVRF